MVVLGDDGKKLACATCIKGHRSSTCMHTTRPLFETRRRGKKTKSLKAGASFPHRVQDIKEPATLMSNISSSSPRHPLQQQPNPDGVSIAGPTVPSGLLLPVKTPIHHPMSTDSLLGSSNVVQLSSKRVRSRTSSIDDTAKIQRVDYSLQVASLPQEERASQLTPPSNSIDARDTPSRTLFTPTFSPSSINYDPTAEPLDSHPIHPSDELEKNPTAHVQPEDPTRNAFTFQLPSLQELLGERYHHLHLSRSRPPSPTSQQKNADQVLPTPFSNIFGGLDNYIHGSYREWRVSKGMGYPTDPVISGMPTLIKLFWVVGALGGSSKVDWEAVRDIMIHGSMDPVDANLLGGNGKVTKAIYGLYLSTFEYHWNTTERNMDHPSDLFPLPPHLQHLHPMIKLAVGLQATEPSPMFTISGSSALVIEEKTSIVPASFGAPDLSGSWTKLDDVPLVTGGNSDIYRARLDRGQRSEENQLIAVKILRSIRIRPDCAPEEILRKRLMREMRVWSQLQHSNIVPFLGYAFSGNFPCMIAPWYENGSIPDYISKNPNANRTQMVLEAMNGLVYLHSLDPPIIHGDLKATNILVDDKGHARITDFGLSRILEEGHSGFTTSTGVMGTHRWMAPELMLNERSRPTTATDIYSMTLLALEIYTGKVPFSHLDQVPFFMAIVAKSSPKRSHYRPFNPPDDVWRVFESGWSFEPSRRPDAQNLRREFESALTSTSWK
ncbi:hypothetical protein FRC02_010503 [Tulasnella sp. 418]|nr:hypothetical protein FRC02_010503 [Tulasnella sp. 418]